MSTSIEIDISRYGQLGKAIYEIYCNPELGAERGLSERDCLIRKLEIEQIVERDRLEGL